MPDAFDNATTLVGGDPERDPLIGCQIRDFRVLELIGRGGMGTVYKAEHLLLGEPRALKVMRAELFQSVPNAVERFQREARIAVKLRHPNLVLLYDFFVERGDYYLVMEYVAGKSLAALLRERGSLWIQETCRIGIQCCAGMAHAHGMGIVHRDLSPENVMLAPSAEGASVKIIDFGVARAAIVGNDQIWVATDTLTGAGEFIGKPRYASPEQSGALRRGETLDQRSDLYTLGLILYEMATGTPPFQSDTALGYLSQHRLQEPARPTLVRPDLLIPPGLERVILRCLEKDRARRFASAGELAAALEWAWHSGDSRDAPFVWELDTGGTARRRASRLAGRIRRGGRRSQLVAIAAGAALALGAAALWWSERPGAIPPLAVAPAPQTPAALAPPEPEEPAPSAPLEPQEEPAESALLPPPEAPAERAPPLREETLAASPPVADPQPAPPAPRTEPRRTSPPANPPEPRVERPAPRRDPGAADFADAAEMQRAFDEALAFESSHDPPAAIERWKRFRSRSPSHELDEKAKRRITELTLRSLQAFP